MRDNRMKFFLLGFNTVVIQLVALRELFSIFSGNELLAGLVLSCWFIFTGLGALLAKFFYSKAKPYWSDLLLTLPLALIVLFLLGFTYFKNQLFLTGVMPGPVEIFLTAAGILFPVCILSGAAFTVLCKKSSAGKNEIASYYAFESLGSIASGALFSFVLIHFFDAYQIIVIIALINVFFFIVFFIGSSTMRSIWFVLFFLLSLSGVLTFTDIKSTALTKLYNGQHIVETVENEYGKLVVTENSGQFNMFDNGVLVNTGSNEMSTEESVHYAMIQRPLSRNVLQVSGNIGLTEQEIRKYSVKQIDYVTINKKVSELEKKYFSSGVSGNFTQFFMDPGIFIRKAGTDYDVVLLNTPEPMYARTNRFYTREFFEDLKKCMNADAVIGLSMPGIENYMSESSAAMNSSIYNTLRSVFGQVILIPGNRLFFIASDGPLTLNIAAAISKYKIENLYVNEYFIDDAQMIRKSDKILMELDLNAPVNHDFRPVTYFYALKFWLSHYQVSLFVPLLVICVVFLLFLIFLRPVNINLLTSGFTASAVEIIVIIAFQAIFGYVYSQIGIIFTLFMAGLFTGAFFLSALLKPRFGYFMGLQVTLLIFLLIVWLFFSGRLHSGTLTQIILFFIVFIQAVITGGQFSLSTKIKDQPAAVNAGNSYGIELFGSGAGALLITTLAVPLIGIPGTLLALLAVNTAGMVVILVNKLLCKRFM